MSEKQEPYIIGTPLPKRTFAEALEVLKQAYRDHPEESEEDAKRIRCSGQIQGFFNIEGELGIYGSTDPGEFTMYLDFLPDEDSPQTKVNTLTFSLTNLEIASADPLTEEQVYEVVETLGLLTAEWELSE